MEGQGEPAEDSGYPAESGELNDDADMEDSEDVSSEASEATVDKADDANDAEIESTIE